MLEERDRRLRLLRQEMVADELDGLVAFAVGWRREEARYLTDAALEGAFALVYLPQQGDPVAFVSGAWDQRAVLARDWVKDARVLALPDCREVGTRVQEDGAIARLGVAHLELMPTALMASIRTELPGVELASATALMDRVRLVKSDWELERIRRAGVVCDAGWQALVEALRPGIAEYEIVAEVEGVLKSLGAEDNFMLFASGADDVFGMTPPGDRRLQPGDMVRTELTPQVEGYYAQICRSAVLGEPDRGQEASFALFKEALEAGLETVRAGVTAHDVARAENDVFRRHGYGEYTTSQYTRVRGHGHGLHPDEVPPIVEGNETVLEEGAVVIVHPNTYTPLAGYQVVGDPVVVTESGYEPLLKTERRLFWNQV